MLFTVPRFATPLLELMIYSTARYKTFNFNRGIRLPP